VAVLKVGLDGRGLGNVNRLRGIGRYTARLMEALARREEDIRFTVFGYGEGPGEGLLDPGTLQAMEWRGIPSLERLSYAGLLGEHLLMAREVERAGVDIFHGIDHNMTPFLRIPSIVTVHDLILLVLRGPYLGPTAWFWMQAHRLAARRARAVVAVSENTARDVERLWGISQADIAVVYEGVTPDYRPAPGGKESEAACARYGVKRPYFLYLGGYDPRKNIHNMLLSFKRFQRASGGGFSMVLCGDSHGFDDYLQDEVEELGLQEDIVFTGFVPENDLPFLYSAATAFVCLSLYEGFGLPLLEAMACGAPVLASRSSSIPEVVGDAGILVDPLEPAAIAAAMERLAHDRGFAAEMSARGLRRAAEFTWDGAAAAIIGLYDKVMRGVVRDQISQGD
jgi:glycosyltransferase involved in cell wall biosynthesis